MALVLGTNCGFVLTAPTTDPGANNYTIDGAAIGFKVTTPSNISKITQIGWWLDNTSTATATVNFEVGLYSDSSGSPNSLLQVSRTNSVNLGTRGVWKTANVDWSVSPNTTYWIFVQVDAATNTAAINFAEFLGGPSVVAAATTLVDPMSGQSVIGNNSYTSIYALYEAQSGPVNIKTIGGLPIASVKTIGGLDKASVKTLGGLG